MARAVDRLDAERESRALYAAVARLPEGQRAVLELVALDGLSPAEAAAALGLSEVSARVRLHRARNAMKSHLGDVSPAPSDEPPTLTSLSTLEATP